MKHLLYKTIILTGLSLFGFCGSAAATTFIDGLEDVPLMKGMTQIQKIPLVSVMKNRALLKLI